MVRIVDCFLIACPAMVATAIPYTRSSRRTYLALSKVLPAILLRMLLWSSDEMRLFGVKDKSLLVISASA